jgi:hypothetical protein
VEGGELYLACTADGRPSDFTYTWEWDNATVETPPTAPRLRLSLDRSGGRFGCLVNNSLGYGEPCHLLVEPEPGYLLTLSHTDALAAVLGAFLFQSNELKVVGNEKVGGFGGWLLFEDGFGPWRSMSF